MRTVSILRKCLKMIQVAEVFWRERVEQDMDIVDVV